MITALSAPTKESTLFPHQPTAPTQSVPTTIAPWTKAKISRTTSKHCPNTYGTTVPSPTLLQKTLLQQHGIRLGCFTKVYPMESKSSACIANSLQDFAEMLEFPTRSYAILLRNRSAGTHQCRKRSGVYGFVCATQKRADPTKTTKRKQKFVN
jgi:hypothetical protein